MEISINGITAWLATHHTWRKFCLVMLASAVGFFVANQDAILAAIPDSVGMIPLEAIFKVMVVPALLGLHNWLKYNSDVPGFSAKPTKKKA